MNLQTIQERLNKEFLGDKRKLIFWYDDNGEFAEDIENLVLDHAKVYRLTEDNILYTKYFLECQDQTSNYLIYAPFSKPRDRDNHLADMFYYSQEFSTDRVTLLCSTYGIPQKHKDQLSKYSEFWKSNNRINKFMALEIEDYYPEIIEIGLLAVLVDIKIPSFDEVLKKMITTDGLRDNKYLEEFKKKDLLRVFWATCNRYYGYQEENPTFEKFMVTLLVTYTATCFQGELPKGWQAYMSHKKNDITVFVSNLMNNMHCKDQYNRIAGIIETKLRVNEFLEDQPLENYWECDAFAAFDRQIIKEMALSLMTNEEAFPLEYREMIRNRRRKKHFSTTYQHYYKALDRADQLLVNIESFEKDAPKEAGDFIALYTSKWSHIDRYYRGFYTAYDQISGDDCLYELRIWLENRYTNAYLLKLSIAWADVLEKVKSWDDLPGEKQVNFYQKQVAPSASKEATVIIISDALRYECGVELNKRLNERPNTKSEIRPMISVLPSFTRLGMAALLPHESITATAAGDVLVDGMPCLSTDQRRKILKAENPLTVVATFNDVMAMNQETLRKLMNGQKVIIIYHDQIDARGDNMASENEVFAAASEAMVEITNLIQKLTTNKSFTNYFITADHGFIYKRDKLDESDKVNLPKESGTFINKRFILSDQPPKIKGSLTYSLDYLGVQNKDTFVTVPRGVDIFKTSGGGQNFVHGGASLQEIVVPLIKVKTETGKREEQNVEVTLTSVNRKLTNLIVYLDFIQNEKVSDQLRPVKVALYFEDEGGEKISDREIIIADRKESAVEKRQFREKFIFKNRKYSKDETYYLVMKDMLTDMEVARHEFIIDIAFADDFGF